MEPIKAVALERTYDAPLEQVWKAWTEAEQLKQWWGPNDVTIPECRIDFRVGGELYIVMEAGEAMGPFKGTLWPMLAKFTTIEPQAKIAFDAHAWTEGQKDETIIEQSTEVLFAEENGKTKVTVKAAIYKTGPEAKMAVEGMQQGFTQQLEKLNHFLGA